uniref:Uncharacterized protein n=1 Tax=Ciona intestinalis TaxID=7719 RepID=H2XKR7_CIOIN
MKNEEIIDTPKYYFIMHLEYSYFRCDRTTWIMILLHLKLF